MLKRLITFTDTKEILTSTVIDVVDTIKLELNTGVDENALTALFMSQKPGTEIPFSKIPYTFTKYLVAINTNGVLSYYPENSILIDYDLKLYDCETYLAVLDEEGKILIHSKYIFDEKGNSGKGVLKVNKLFVEPFIIVPDLGQ